MGGIPAGEPVHLLYMLEAYPSFNLTQRSQVTRFDRDSVTRVVSKPCFVNKTHAGNEA